MKKLIPILISIFSIGAYVACDVSTIEEDKNQCDTDCSESPSPPVDPVGDVLNELDPQKVTCSSNTYDLCLGVGIATDYYYACTYHCSDDTTCTNDGCGCREPTCVMKSKSGTDAPLIRTNGNCEDSSYSFECGGCRRWIDNAGPNMQGAWQEVGFELTSGTCSNGTAVCLGLLHDCNIYDGLTSKRVPFKPSESSVGCAGTPCSGAQTCSTMGWGPPCADCTCAHDPGTECPEACQVNP